MAVIQLPSVPTSQRFGPAVAHHPSEVLSFSSALFAALHVLPLCFPPSSLCLLPDFLPAFLPSCQVRLCAGKLVSVWVTPSGFIAHKTGARAHSLLALLRQSSRPFAKAGWEPPEGTHRRQVGIRSFQDLMGAAPLMRHDMPTHSQTQDPAAAVTMGDELTLIARVRKSVK